MAVSTKKRIDYHAHIETWLQSGLSKIKYCENANISYSYFKALSSKLKQNEVVNPGFIEVKPSVEQDLGAILQVSLPNGVRIGVSCPKTNILIEQVLTFVGQLP